MTNIEAAGNQVTHEMPAPRSDLYAVVAPRWFTAMLRFQTAALVAITAWFAFRSWSEIPVAIKLLLWVLWPALSFVALHPTKGWGRFSTQPFLLANRSGMYFPSHRPYVLGQTSTSSWLFVPWHNIANLRVDKFSDSDGTSACAAFDVRASEEHIGEFFLGRTKAQVQAPASDAMQSREFVAVAFYAHRPPHPRKVVENLANLRDPA